MIFASPRENVFIDNRKSSRVLVLYMPLFDLAELHDCAPKVAKFNTLEGSDIDKGFAVAGGIARVVLLSLAHGWGPGSWIRDVKHHLFCCSWAPRDVLHVRCADGTLHDNVACCITCLTKAKQFTDCYDACRTTCGKLTILAIFRTLATIYFIGLWRISPLQLSAAALSRQNCASTAKRWSDTLLRMLRRWSAGPWAQGNKDSSVLFGHWNQCTAGSRTCLCVRAPCPHIPGARGFIPVQDAWE